MTETFHAVEAARQWRERVTGEVVGMSADEKIAFFARFESVDVLRAPAIPTDQLPVPTSKHEKKDFDAVVESRKWRAATSRKLNAMTPEQRLAYLNRDAALERTRQDRERLAQRRKRPASASS